MPHTHVGRRRWSAATVLLAPLCAVSLLTGPALGGFTQQSSTTDRLEPVTAQAAQTSSRDGARPFHRRSYWNTPLGHAPHDPHSRQYIRDAQQNAHSQNYLKLVMGDWAMPTYRSSAADRVYRINPVLGPTVRVHIPAGARSMPTYDGALTVTDTASHQVIGLGGARYHRKTDRWTARGVSRYWADTNGIARGLPGGSKGNLGHRGIPGSVQAVTKREIRRGAIRHRLEIYWWETAPKTPSGREAYFPMTGSESHNAGRVPEGIVIRIRRSVDLESKHLSPAGYTIARALQRYGAVVGDNSGSGNNLKVQANTKWAGILTARALRSIPWRDYVFVKGGYRP
jgi:hypothetical protein